MEKVPVDVNAKKGLAKCQVGQGKADLPLRERLLEHLLLAIQKAKSSNSFGETLENLLWKNHNLLAIMRDNKTNCLIGQKKILSSIPNRRKSIVRKFLNDFLLGGGQRPC